MSIPRNHHYVSQVLSRKFFSDEGDIFVYNKINGKNHVMTSSRKLFSQRDLNTIIDENGEVDHKSVENVLSKHFETDFPKHYDIVVGAMNSGLKVGEKVPNPEEVQIAIEYLIGMALIGPFRHPQKMKENQTVILGMLQNIAKDAADELRNEILDTIEVSSDVNNKTPVDFKDLKDGIFELMGDVKFGIMRAPDNHFFLLPDSNSGIQRFPVKPDDIDGELYQNQSMPIGLALMPLNSKLILTAVSRSLLPEGYRNQLSGFYDLNKETVKSYNQILFESAYEGVACENKEYLEVFLKSINLQKIFNTHN